MGIFLSLVLARELGPLAYGEFALVLAMVGLAQTLCSLGLQQVELRFLATAISLGRAGEAAALGSGLWATRLALSLVGGCLVLALVTVRFAATGSWSLILAAGCFGTLKLAFESTRSLLIPIQRPAISIWLELLRVCALPLAALIVVRRGAMLPEILFTLSSVQLLLLVAAVGTVVRASDLRPKWSARLGSEHWRFATTSYLTNLALLTQSNVGMLLLSFWTDLESVGHLAIGLQGLQVARGVAMAVRRAWLPALAELAETGRLDRVKDWGAVVLLVGIAAAAIAMLAWFACGRVLISWILGGEFDRVFPIATTLLLSLGPYLGASTCNGLLYVLELRWLGATSAVLYAVATVLGLVFLRQINPSLSAEDFALVHLLATFGFWLLSDRFLRSHGGLDLPSLEAIFLLAPCCFLLPAVSDVLGPVKVLLASTCWFVLYFTSLFIRGTLPGRTRWRGKCRTLDSRVRAE